MLALASDLAAVPPAEVELEVRCARETRALLEKVFPAGTRFWSPIARTRPRLLRILVQHVLAPLRDGPATVVVALGEQGALWGRASLVLVVHDVRRLTDPATSSRLEGAYYRFVVPRAARRARLMITVSEFSRREIAATLGEKVPLRVVAHHPRPRVSRPGGDVRGPIIVVGALRPYKRIETVIDAVALLDPEERREVVFAGPTEGREDQLQRRAAAQGVADTVRFAGWLEELELERLYACAHASVSPSAYEGYGLPVAESLAFGLPTIATAIPPHREIGGNAVLYFEPGDAGALAAHLRLLARDEGRRAELAAAALERSRALARLGPSWAELIAEAVSP